MQVKSIAECSKGAFCYTLYLHPATIFVIKIFVLSIFEWHFSDYIQPFLQPYMRVIPNPKKAFIFPSSHILALIFPILIKYFPKCEGKGSFLKSQIKPLHFYTEFTVTHIYFVLSNHCIVFSTDHTAH